jgi:hypothetical protein
MSTNPDHHPDQGIFGLPEPEIRALVGSAVGAELAACRIVERRADLPGLAAEKVLARFAYRTTAAADGEITLFWKRMYGLDIAEAHQYRFLADHDLPIPKLHGTAFGAKEEEIIVLERLDGIGIDHNDPREVREFASLLARLNAVRLRSEDPWKPPAHEIARQLAEGTTVAARVARIWKEALTGTWGVELERWCRANLGAGERLVRRGIELGARLRRLPRAILHEDYAPANTGWRGGRGQLVIFDLHRLSLGPRFWDAGIALGTPEQPAYACLPWDELASHYLAELERYGGSGAPLAIYRDEIELARRCAELDDLKWNLREVLWFHGQGRDERHAQRSCAALLARLELLLRQCA